MLSFDRLSDEQKVVVEATGGPIIVDAGPGSGKTTTIAARIAHLLSTEDGLLPDEILAVTFTSAAATRLRHAISDFVSYRPAEFIGVSTCHSLAWTILRANAAKFLRDYRDVRGVPVVGYKTFPTLLAPDHRQRIIDSLLQSTSVPTFEYALYGRAISIYIGSYPHLDSFRAQRDDRFMKFFDDLVDRYRAYLLEHSLIDYDYMLYFAWRFLERSRSLRDIYAFKYVFVDEYQDTNYLQDAFVSLMCKPDMSNLCVVGDAAQAIYSFRGSIPDLFTSFIERYPNAYALSLKQNYRSVQPLVCFSNFVSGSFGQKKECFSVDPGLMSLSAHLNLSGFVDDEEEANFLPIYIKQRNDAGVPWGDIAVFCRTRHLLSLYEVALSKAGVPYTVDSSPATDSDPQDFEAAYVLKCALHFIDVAVNHTVSSLKFIVDHELDPGLGLPHDFSQFFSVNFDWDKFSDTLELEKCMLAGLDEPSLQTYSPLHKFFHYIHEVLPHMSPQHAFSDLFRSFFYSPDPEVSMERPLVYPGLEQFYFYASVYQTLPDFCLNHPQLDLLALPDYTFLSPEILPDDNKVSLLTTHSAKGLEFDTVIVPAFEKGYYPHYRATDCDEEKRLFYVALTRAKARVLLTHALSRRGRSAEHSVFYDYLREYFDFVEPLMGTNRSMLACWLDPAPSSSGSVWGE